MSPFTVEGGKWKCQLCNHIDGVRALFICPPHGLHQESGPQPAGVPRNYPCPGQPTLDGGGTSGTGAPPPPEPHDVYPSGLNCIFCNPWGNWFPPPYDDPGD